LIANILAMNQRIKHTNKTLYTSPYMVITDQEYTKHYYAGSERIASKLGGGFELASVNPTDDNHDLAPITSYTGIPEFYDQKKAGLMELLSRSWDCVNMQGYASIEGEQLLSIEELQNSNNPENEMFFYHTDHLGSSSWISDASGNAYQHLQYMPYGEQFIEQRQSTWGTPYQFTGKELDSETGYSYFGARYYDSDLSVWLSVDPLADKYPSTSPFLYVENNPIMFYDPDGRLKNPFRSKQYLQAKAYQEKVGGTLIKDGFRKWRVEHVNDEISEWPKDLIIQGEYLKGAEVISTKFYDVQKGVEFLEAAGVNGEKIVNSSMGFFKTLGRDLRQLEIKLDGQSWTKEQKDKFEKKAITGFRVITGMVFPVIRVLSWGYTFGSYANNRKDGKENIIE
jgi:RHS repeat-associated protein